MPSPLGSLVYPPSSRPNVRLNNVPACYGRPTHHESATQRLPDSYRLRPKNTAILCENVLRYESLAGGLDSSDLPMRLPAVPLGI
jgi:hypothetical protein